MFSGVSLLEHFPNATDDTLYYVTVHPQATASDGTSIVLAYRISDNNIAMDNSLVACAAGEDRAAVWDHRFPDHFAKICRLPSTNVC